MTSNPNSPNFNYKDYSLEKLQEWIHDAMSSDASPHEIYSAIREAVREDYDYHKNSASRAYGLLELLSGNRPVADKDLYDKRAKLDAQTYSDRFKTQNGVSYNEYTKARVEANSAWNDGFTQKYYQDIVDKYEGKQDKVKKWVLPIEETKIAETDETEYFVSFPDDLLEAANLKEGDQVEWIDRGDGSYQLKKVKKPMTYEEAYAAGWTMTDDGIWWPPQDAKTVSMDEC